MRARERIEADSFSQWYHGPSDLDASRAVGCQILSFFDGLFRRCGDEGHGRLGPPVGLKGEQAGVQTAQAPGQT